jgi:pilus assembly protein CpaB
VSRRSRAVGFALAAVACAALAAAAAGDYRGGIEAQLGELRPVVVARAEVARRHPLGPRDVARLLEVRRVPARFAPIGAIADPLQVVGRRPAAAIPAGAYVTANLLRAAGPSGRPSRSTVGRGREAVEVTVTGAEALAAAGRDPTGMPVDVVATGEPKPGTGIGRTTVAAEGVKLLALRESGPSQDAGGLGPTGPSSWVATLATTREQALRLIHAHNYARELRLIAAGR